MPFFASIAGAVVAGLVQFMASKAGTMLAGLGLTYISVKGLQTVIGYIVSDVNLIANSVSSGGSGSTGLGMMMIQMAAYAGLFDGLNIVISGYMAGASMLGLKVMLSRLK